MKFNFETRLKVFFIIIIAGIIGIAVFTFNYYQSVNRVTQALSESNQLHNMSQALLMDIQELELNTRAYILTADSAYLGHYEEAKTNLLSHLDQINTLTRDNPTFQRRIRTLSILVKQKLVYTKELINQRDSSGVDLAIKSFQAGPANDLNEHMRFTIKTIESEEDHLFKKRNQDYTSQFLNLRYTYYALLISLLIAVSIIGYFTIYQTQLRKIREERLKQSEKMLDLRVKKSMLEIKKQYEALREIAEIQSHQVRAPIATILGLIGLFNTDDPTDPINAEVLQRLKSATESFDDVIEQIVKMTNEIESLQLKTSE
jgi:CHASE3 domain sensor protein